MTIRNVNDDGRSVKWRARKVINLSSLSDRVLFFHPMFHGTSEENFSKLSNTIMKCDLDSTRCKFDLRCIEVKITEAAKRSRIHQWTWTYFPVFSWLLQLLSPLDTIPRGIQFAQQRNCLKFSAARGCFWHENILLFWAEIKPFAVVVEGRKNCPLAEKC